MTRAVLPAAVAAGLALAGCASEKVVPATGLVGETVCVVRNPNIKSQFLDIVARQVRDNGYAVTVADTEEEARDCKVRMTYYVGHGDDFRANYSLRKARISVFRGAELVGSLEYKGHGGPMGIKLPDLVTDVLPPQGGSPAAERDRLARLQRLEHLHERGMVSEADYRKERDALAPPAAP